MRNSYSTVSSVQGPLIIVNETKGVGNEELCKVKLPSGEEKLGKVLSLYESSDGVTAVVQLFEDTRGIPAHATVVEFLGEGLKMSVGPEILGRIFDGAGRPRDGIPMFLASKKLDINGLPLNPKARTMPNEFIQTGISTIDVLNTLVRGQKLPIFSGAGLPHAELAAQIARNASVRDGSKFTVVFGAMGVTRAESEYFMKELENSGAQARSILFLNEAADPVVERITLPRVALTVAEYLAYECDHHVLVILTDMTNYAEALREISAAKNEIPGRRGFPSYLYTDLASLYERAGRVHGKEGSVTQLPILTMPDDDRTHPIPDLTGYITEGQIQLSRDLNKQGITPPVEVLPSLSRLRSAGIGEGKTRADHANVADQLFAAYARGLEVRELAVILGESSLSEVDRAYLTLAQKFEKEFVDQNGIGEENRSIEESLTVAWRILSYLPKAELKRVKPVFIEQYYKS